MNFSLHGLLTILYSSPTYWWYYQVQYLCIKIFPILELFLSHCWVSNLLFINIQRQNEISLYLSTIHCDICGNSDFSWIANVRYVLQLGIEPKKSEDIANWITSSRWWRYWFYCKFLSLTYISYSLHFKLLMTRIYSRFIGKSNKSVENMETLFLNIFGFIRWCLVDHFYTHFIACISGIPIHQLGYWITSFAFHSIKQLFQDGFCYGWFRFRLEFHIRWPWFR